MSQYLWTWLYIRTNKTTYNVQCLFHFTCLSSRSLSHRPRSRCPLLSASLSASGGKRAALAWRDRQMKENKWRQRVMKQGAKWRRRERYEDRCIYRERESKKSEIIFSPWCLYWQFTLGALHCYTWVQRDKTKCATRPFSSTSFFLTLCQTVPYYFNSPFYLCADVR